MSALVAISVPLVDRPVNALTVDVEDYFQVYAFERQVPFGEWDGKRLRVADNVARILDLFDQKAVKGTFFTLGWLAERLPGMVRDIAARGHEVASHGYRHTRVFQQDPGAFRDDVVKTKKILEDIAGKEVIGYRAASYSIGSGNLWALDVLGDTGHRYSSSVYPINHDIYGMPDAPRFACRLGESKLTEFPVSTVRMFATNWPSGGGGYFRLLPYALSKWLISRINEADRQSAIFYFHPWEIDPGQPRMRDASLKAKFRHYLNLGRMEQRLTRLLGDFAWDRMDRVFGLR